MNRTILKRWTNWPVNTQEKHLVTKEMQIKTLKESPISAQSLSYHQSKQTPKGSEDRGDVGVKNSLLTGVGWGGGMGCQSARPLKESK